MGDRRSVYLGGFAALAAMGLGVAVVAFVDRQVSDRPEVCSGYVALTFDDGPTALTPELLDVLDQHDVPAMFFTTGVQTRRFPEHVRDMVERGHQVGHHTWDHPDLTTVPSAELVRQIEKASRLHETIAEPFEFFRPPFGATDPDVQAEVRRQGMVEVLWTADSKDYQATTPADVVERTAGMTDGGIALLHDGKPLTIEAIPAIIDHYHDRGLCFGAVVATTEPTIPPWSQWMGYYAKAGAPEAGSGS